METTLPWCDVETPHQKAILEVFSGKINYDDQQTLATIFKLANPRITFPEDRKYFRIEEESGPTLLLLLKNYL